MFNSFRVVGLSVLLGPPAGFLFFTVVMLGFQGLGQMFPDTAEWLFPSRLILEKIEPKTLWQTLPRLQDFMTFFFLGIMFSYIFGGLQALLIGWVYALTFAQPKWFSLAVALAVTIVICIVTEYWFPLGRNDHIDTNGWKKVRIWCSFYAANFGATVVLWVLINKYLRPKMTAACVKL
jgi:hypothetical protein